MVCPYYTKLCGKCRKWVCRAYFPERQPYITENMRPTCEGDNYETECLIYGGAAEWQKERKRLSLETHCPFASNTVCGKPWLWICKGGTTPFFLTEADEAAGRDGRMRRDENGNIVFKPGKSVDDIKDACLSGKMEVYEGCPRYKEGMEQREYVKQLKKRGNI